MDPDPNWAKHQDLDPNSMYLDPQHWLAIWGRMLNLVWLASAIWDRKIYLVWLASAIWDRKIYLVWLASAAAPPLAPSLSPPPGSSAQAPPPSPSAQPAPQPTPFLKKMALKNIEFRTNILTKKLFFVGFFI